MKIDLLNTKTLLKNLLLKHLKRSKILILKNLLKNNSNGGIFIPHLKSARWQLESAKLPFRSTGRSTGQRSYFLRLSLRSTGPVDRDWIQRAELSAGRPTRSTEAISRQQSSLDGRPSRSTSPPAQAGVHACARRSTALVDRLLQWSTVRSTGRQPVQLIWD